MTSREPASPAAGGSTELAVYARFPVEFVRGEGTCVFDAQGRRYVDFYAGHAVALTGHCHPRVVQAVQRQAAALVFYSSAAPSALREQVGQLLVRHAPSPEYKVFHCCSGSEANEVAFKLARQVTGRVRVLSFRGSFHGRTLAALSAGGIERYRQTARPVLMAEHVVLPLGDEAALERTLDETVAAVIVEGIQSLGGVIEGDPDFWRLAASLARARGAALIFDEVQTGLGRTGTFFFYEQLGLVPDIVTVAKGLASGIPAAAVLVAPWLASQVRVGDHGSTFGGGPVAMAAAQATLAVIEEERLAERAGCIGALLADEVRRCPGVRAVRGRGLLLGVELAQPAAAVQRALLERGVVVGTSALPQVLRLLPPLIVGEEEVAVLGGALRSALGGERRAGRAVAAPADCSPARQSGSDELYVIKIGGDLLRDLAGIGPVMAELAAAHRAGRRIVLVHGGGPQITAVQRALGQAPHIVNGRRVTDAAALDVAKMVLAGRLNTDLVAAISGAGTRAVGLTGADGPSVVGARRPPRSVTVNGRELEVDYGLVADIRSVRTELLRLLVAAGYVPVLASLAVTEDGGLLNVNADTVAGEVAAALGASRLVFLTNVPGVRGGPEGAGPVLPVLDLAGLQQVLAIGAARGGMLPKIAAVQRAVAAGVGATLIVDGRDPGAVRMALAGRPAGTLVRASRPVDGGSEVA